MLSKVGVSEPFFRNKRRKFVKTVVKNEVKFVVLVLCVAT